MQYAQVVFVCPHKVHFVSKRTKKISSQLESPYGSGLRIFFVKMAKKQQLYQGERFQRTTLLLIFVAINCICASSLEYYTEKIYTFTN